MSEYKDTLRALQIQLTRLQRHVIQQECQIAIIFEGRDASGKDGVIKRITEHLSPRDTRVVALPAPSDRDKRSWYFQRYITHLPARGEMVLFNRSWYNRAGVEAVMGFCSPEETEAFFKVVPVFEMMLREAGIQIVKYYLDISKDEQQKRLDERAKSPLTQWKISPIDAIAQAKWDDYSAARDRMLAHTHSPDAPWVIVNANDKRSARLNIIRDILHRVEFLSESDGLPQPDRTILRNYDQVGSDFKLYA